MPLGTNAVVVTRVHCIKTKAPEMSGSMRKGHSQTAKTEISQCIRRLVKPVKFDVPMILLSGSCEKQ